MNDEPTPTRKSRAIPGAGGRGPGIPLDPRRRHGRHRVRSQPLRGRLPGVVQLEAAGVCGRCLLAANLRRSDDASVSRPEAVHACDIRVPARRHPASRDQQRHSAFIRKVRCQPYWGSQNTTTVVPIGRWWRACVWASLSQQRADDRSVGSCVRVARALAGLGLSNAKRRRSAGASGYYRNSGARRCKSCLLRDPQWRLGMGSAPWWMAGRMVYGATSFSSQDAHLSSGLSP